MDIAAVPASALRNPSSSSSTFFSANQSPSSPGCCFPDPCHTDMGSTRLAASLDAEASSSTGIHNTDKNKIRDGKRTRRSPPAASLFVNRSRSCDIYIGFHGRNPMLLRFSNWLRAELEVQGLSCFITDRARCGSGGKHGIVEKAMEESTFGVVILSRKSFKNPYSIEELRLFSKKKNLVPIYYDLGPDDCLVRDIIEKRGEVWERHGGELWLLYGGVEEEWRDAVSGLSRGDDWKLDAHDGKWRDCILRAVTLLALRLGRRSVVERLTKSREKAERDEFPFPQNENFVGRRSELSELEFMLFGGVCGDSERDYFEIKTRPMRTRRRRRRKNFAYLTIGWGRTNSRERKGKEPIVWKESEKEIEMENTAVATMRSKTKHRSSRVVYGKGIACVSGDAGIGKTELLLEFAYRFHQRYKMVLWIGGESRYIQQNFLNHCSFLEVDVGVESFAEKSFEEQEEAAVARVGKELMRNIPFLVIIDNLESEKDWWDHKVVMDLLPHFGGESHVIISTRLPRVMNIEPLRLSYLSEVEAMSLMQGRSIIDQSNTEIDALQTIEMKLGRLTLGLAIVGAILSELPINPSRLLDTVNRIPLRDILWMDREDHVLRRNKFLLQLFEVCFSIFDHADGPKSLATRMVLACGWFAPSPIPVSILALAAHKLQVKHRRRLWRKIKRSLTCGFSVPYARRSEAEACSLLLRFNLARSCMKDGFIQFNQLVKTYARKRGTAGVAQSMVQSVICRGSVLQHLDHIWAACFLVFGFRKDPVVVEMKATELLVLIKEVVLPLGIRTFITFSRCRAALELLSLATDALEAADQAFVTPVEKWVDRSMCWKPIKTNAQLNPCLWQELALTRATVLEVRAKLMMRGGEYNAGDDLIRKVIFIRTSICGEDHPSTVSARETLGKLVVLMANAERYTSP